MKYGNKIKMQCNTCKQKSYYMKMPENRNCQRDGCPGTVFVMRDNNE